MKKVLSQQEIDAILGKARAELKVADGGAKRVVQTCDFRTAGQMSEAYARFLTNLYEGFARSASNSLGAFLRAHFEMVLASVEQLPVRDFIAAYQQTGFVAVLSLRPRDITVLLQIETALVFPIIDVLLGGFGAPTPEAREMTEIDRGIMEGVCPGPLPSVGSNLAAHGNYRSLGSTAKCSSGRKCLSAHRKTDRVDL